MSTKRKGLQKWGDAPNTPHPTPAQGTLCLLRAGDQHTSGDNGFGWAVLSVPGGWPSARLSPGSGGGGLEGEDAHSQKLQQHKHPIHQAQGGEQQRTKSVCSLGWFSKHVQVL